MQNASAQTEAVIGLRFTATRVGSAIPNESLSDSGNTPLFEDFHAFGTASALRGQQR
jgi:hypothetical protein